MEKKELTATGIPVAVFVKAYLVVRPDTIWFDDDFRANHTPVAFGCFCDVCIRAFNEEYGSAFSREELVNEISMKNIDFVGCSEF